MGFRKLFPLVSLLGTLSCSQARETPAILVKADCISELENALLDEPFVDIFEEIQCTLTIAIKKDTVETDLHGNDADKFYYAKNGTKIMVLYKNTLFRGPEVVAIKRPTDATYTYP